MTIGEIRAACRRISATCERLAAPGRRAAEIGRRFGTRRASVAKGEPHHK